MKKTLAIVLSVMMVLSLCAGMFSFAAEKGYAETEADKFWGEAVKANAITLQVNGKLVDVKTAVTDVKIADLFKDVELVAEADKATTTVTMEGSISFDANGNLTIKGAKATKTVKATEEGKEDTVDNYSLLIFANGGLKVVIEKGFTGSIRGLDHKNAAKEDVKVPAKSHLIVTSADHSTWTMPANGIGWDNGNVVVYGDIRLDANAGDASGNYDCIIVRDNTSVGAHKEKGWSLILAPEYATFYSGGAKTVENRSGELIVCDDAIIVGTSREGAVLHQSGVGFGMTIRDNAMVHLTTTACASWGATVVARNFNMNGGTLVLDMTAGAAVAATTALNVQGAAAENSAMNFNGGKVFINVAPTKDSTASTRTNAIFAKNTAADAINFKGSEVYVKASTVTGSAANGAIYLQGTSQNVNMTAGKVTIETDANANAIRTEVAASTIKIAGGDLVVKGAKELVSSNKDDTKLNVAAAAKIDVAAAAMFVSKPVAVEGITLDAAATSLKQGTATAITEKAPAAPEAPKIDVPETSDASVVAIAVVALISVAAAVVVLRKRVNG